MKRIGETSGSSHVPSAQAEATAPGAIASSAQRTPSTLASEQLRPRAAAGGGEGGRPTAVLPARGLPPVFGSSPAEVHDATTLQALFETAEQVKSSGTRFVASDPRMRGCPPLFGTIFTQKGDLRSMGKNAQRTIETIERLRATGRWRPLMDFIEAVKAMRWGETTAVRARPPALAGVAQQRVAVMSRTPQPSQAGRGAVQNPASAGPIRTNALPSPQPVRSPVSDDPPRLVSQPDLSWLDMSPHRVVHAIHGIHQRGLNRAEATAVASLPPVVLACLVDPMGRWRDPSGLRAAAQNLPHDTRARFFRFVEQVLQGFGLRIPLGPPPDESIAHVPAPALPPPLHRAGKALVEVSIGPAGQQPLHSSGLSAGASSSGRPLSGTTTEPLLFDPGSHPEAATPRGPVREKAPAKQPPDSATDPAPAQPLMLASPTARSAELLELSRGSAIESVEPGGVSLSPRKTRLAFKPSLPLNDAPSAQATTSEKGGPSSFVRMGGVQEEPRPKRAKSRPPLEGETREVWVQTDLDMARTSWSGQKEVFRTIDGVGQWSLVDGSRLSAIPARIYPMEPDPAKDWEFPLRDPADATRVHPRYAGLDGRCSPKVGVSAVIVPEVSKHDLRQLGGLRSGRPRMRPRDFDLVFEELSADIARELSRRIHDQPSEARHQVRRLLQADTQAHETTLIGQNGLFGVHTPGQPLPTFRHGRILGFYSGVLIEKLIERDRQVALYGDDLVTDYQLNLDFREVRTANKKGGYLSKFEPTASISAMGHTNSMAIANTALKPRPGPSGVPEYDQEKINAVLVPIDVELTDKNGIEHLQTFVTMVAFDNLFGPENPSRQVRVDYGPDYLTTLGKAIERAHRRRVKEEINAPLAEAAPDTSA